MKQADVDAKVAALRAAGRTNDEIRKVLFNTKGVRLAQIRKAGVL